MRREKAAIKLSYGSTMLGNGLPWGGLSMVEEQRYLTILMDLQFWWFEDARVFVFLCSNVLYMYHLIYHHDLFIFASKFNALPAKINPH